MRTGVCHKKGTEARKPISFLLFSDLRRLCFFAATSCGPYNGQARRPAATVSAERGLTVLRAGAQARRMSSEPIVTKKKLPLVKLGILVVVVGVCAVFLLRGVNL